MTTHTADEDATTNPSQCWCCGAIEDPARMVRLGNHPEVALCVRCARWAAKQAWEIEDQGRTGPLVTARDRLRAARRGVVRRGWHQHRLLGGPVRWIGKRLP
jgi:hypothetical protein